MRYIEIVPMQGDEAFEVIDMWSDDADKALDHLIQWDDGEETEAAATVNGHVYREDPAREAWVTRYHVRGNYLMVADGPGGTTVLFRVVWEAGEIEVSAEARQLAETTLWQASDENGDQLSKSHHADDIDREHFAHLVNDWLNFAEANAAVLALHHGAVGRGRKDSAHDYVLTRNQDGAGFWDRGSGSYGDDLSMTARADGTADAYVGDDGRIYIG